MAHPSTWKDKLNKQKQMDVERWFRKLITTFRLKTLTDVNEAIRGAIKQNLIPPDKEQVLEGLERLEVFILKNVKQ